MRTKGNSAKDSGYLKRIKDATEHDKEHPRHHGIRMQAHHLISGEGMKRSAMGRQVAKSGYNINLLPNLTFIPSTLQGACYLGVQPHRGNHDVLLDEDDYVDDMEPYKYHEMVSRRLQGVKSFVLKHCAGKNPEDGKKVIALLNFISEKILASIQDSPIEAPLTRIALRFGKSGVGCGGTDSVTSHTRHKNCPVGRNHFFDEKNPENSQGTGQKCEKISYRARENFRLRIGK